jgi:putative aminopeptidase FrvX
MCTHYHYVHRNSKNGTRLEKLKQYIKELSRVPSVSGSEDVLAELLISFMEGKVDSCSRDTIGNVIGVKKGSEQGGVRLLFEAHLDQIGLMIHRIEENGILRFTGIGGVNPATICGKRVRVYGREELFGIIGMKPPHIATKEETSRVSQISELFIDIGCRSQKEASKYVAPGDTAVVDYYSDWLLGDHFTSGGLDNRAGVYALLGLVDLLQESRHIHEVLLLFSVQEEVGLRGAKVAGYALTPDVAVVCDVTFGDPVGNPTEITTGKGPVVGKGPNFYPPLVHKICEIARREDIPFQEEVEERPGGTDAYYLQITKRGVYTAGIYVPLRYMHSPVEVINVKDVYRASKLMLYLTFEKNILSGIDQNRGVSEQGY